MTQDAILLTNSKTTLGVNIGIKIQLISTSLIQPLTVLFTHPGRQSGSLYTKYTSVKRAHSLNQHTLCFSNLQSLGHSSYIALVRASWDSQRSGLQQSVLIARSVGECGVRHVHYSMCGPHPQHRSCSRGVSWIVRRDRTSVCTLILWRKTKGVPTQLASFYFSNQIDQ